MMMNYQHHVEIEEAIDDENENEKKSAGGGGGGVVMVEREHMFDKVVTPSDVGKLNRLVIPKQHAEKYFPLDSSNNEKGLLLNFEDGTGKPWRFRYSYWNSSQSYVMTKGWSRFVKEKKLDAGDIVSFQRGVGVGEFGKDKLFIDWRRRPDHNHHHIGSSYNLPHHAHAFLPHHHHHNQFYHHSVSHGRAPTPPTFVLRSHPYPHPNSYPYPQQQQPGLIRRPGSGGVGSGYYGYGSVVNPYPVTGSLIFLRSTTSSSGGMTTTTGMMNTTTHQVDEEEEGEETLQNVYESVPVVQGKAASKRLRLFGVNMECTTTPPISHQTHDFDILSSALASSSSSSSSINHHHHHHTSTSTQISMGPPPYTTPTSSTSLPLQLRSFFNGTSSSPSAKGKSSNTSSSSMSLDLDI